VDFTACANADDVCNAVIQAVPGWLAGYGLKTSAGFMDGLTDHLLHPRRPLVVLVLTALPDLSAAAGTTPALVLLDHLASVARWHLLFRRWLICLVETTDPELELVCRVGTVVMCGVRGVRWREARVADLLSGGRLRDQSGNHRGVRVAPL
jgi:hypothetical protein